MNNCKTTADDYKEYVKQCSDKGFNLDKATEDNSFSASHTDGYSLSVEYTENDRIIINVAIIEYEINIEVECAENWIFSTYDVNIYIDDSKEGTLAHGTTETYSVKLTKGSHTVNFESIEDNPVNGKAEINVSKDDTIKFHIYCTSTEIDVTNMTEDEEKDVTSKEEETESTATKETETESNSSSQSSSKTSSSKTSSSKASSSKASSAVDNDYNDNADNGEMVWIPQSGSKYHSNPNCSGMKNPQQVSKESAESMGYTPCKKCY